MRLPSLALVVSLVGFVVAACSSSNGGGGPPAVGDAGTCGGFGAPTDPVCDSCFSASCCGTGVTCHANTECSLLFECIQNCTDDNCITTCQGDHPTGMTDVNALFNCITTSCSAQCTSAPVDAGGGADAGMCGGYGAQDPTCNACLDGSCCTEAAACGASADCDTLFSCVQACAQGDTACQNTCATNSPNGVATYNAFTSCMSNACSTACSGGDAGVPPADAGMCGGYGSSNPTCNACLDGSCCTQASACGASADCSTLFNCVQACAQGDATCQNTCATNSPNGVATYNAFIDCMNTNCTTACGAAPADAATGG
jgi:hypothetical protein